MPNLSASLLLLVHAFRLLTALLLTPFVSRLFLVFDRESGLAWQDLRGFLSDLGVALLLVPVLMLLRRTSRWLGLVFILVWTLLHWANFENVRDLDAFASAFDLKFFGDATFVFGSAAAISRPFVLLVLCLGAAVLVWFARVTWSNRAAIASLLVAIVALAVQAAWPISDELAAWRQVDFIQANIVYLATRSEAEPEGGRDARAAMLELVPEMAADISGEPMLPLPGEAKNVLLVVVEGVSGAFAPYLAEDHGLTGFFAMPNLDRVARQNLSYSTFVNHNRKTNKGLFSLLCGEPPSLRPGTPKMTQVAMVGGRICLPHVLQGAGFRTAFIQAAPLAFMLKGRFAANAGFDDAYGALHFDADRAYARSRWGVDDLALFEQSLEIIAELDAAPEPWFASILTVGTHHPFIYPKDSAGEDTDRVRAAFNYADHAVGRLVEDLESRGILEDTLVLITSDESRGLESPRRSEKTGVGGLTRRLSQNWGVLVALQPEGVVDRIKTPFSQMDVAVSIVDYLGLAERGKHFFGRSVFRQYSASRFLPFANMNRLRVGAFDQSALVIDCNIDNEKCSTKAVADGSLFNLERAMARPSDPSESLLLDFARRSQREIEEATGGYEVELMAEPRQRVQAKRVLHGGPYVSLLPGQWLEVEIDVEARGEAGRVALLHEMGSSYSWRLDRAEDFDRREAHRDRIYAKRFELRPGERLRLHYTVVPEGDDRLDGTKCVTDAVVNNGPPFDLIFHKATMTIHTGGDKPDPGFQLQSAEIERPGS